jgi:glycogen debranching enzyme
MCLKHSESIDSIIRQESVAGLQNLHDFVQTIGKPDWCPMLAYVAELHARSTHAARFPFTYPWEEIGPGYCYGPAFGHWDIVHAALDVLQVEPEHAYQQLVNNFSVQQDDGLLPGSIWFGEGKPQWNQVAGHPPVWPYAIDQLFKMHSQYDTVAFRERCFLVLARQIEWFENNRSADPQGFYYTDILNHTWESGVDDGVRFLNTQSGPYACVDATSHLFALYEKASIWGNCLKKDVSDYMEKSQQLRKFIQDKLYSLQTRFFHDVWNVDDPDSRVMTLEGAWPMIVGAATESQANGVIENLMNPQLFLSDHPLTTVSMNDPRFELRMWRGPAWNSMTYWVALGCLRYQRSDAAETLLEKALDQSAKQFEQTGTIWEFYHPFGGDPRKVARKPGSKQNCPCPDYLGHNPLIAMTSLWHHTKNLNVEESRENN